MKDTVKNLAPVASMLFPYEPEQFWQSIRQIVREEVSRLESPKPEAPLYDARPHLQTPP